MNDKDEARENFMHPFRHLPNLRDCVWISPEQLARELELFSEARFDKQREDLRAELCSGHDFDFYRMAEREDSRIGKEL